MRKIYNGLNMCGEVTQKVFNQIDQRIANEENLFFFGFNEDHYRKYARLLQEKGYTVCLFNLEDVTHSQGWNPLTLVKHYYNQGKKDRMIQLLQSMGHTLFEQGPNSDPFWENCANDYWTGLVLTLLENAKDEELNFESIYALSHVGNQSSENGLKIQDYVRTLGSNHRISLYLTPTVMAPRDTRGSILSVFQSEMNSILGKEQLLDVLSKDDISFPTLKNKFAIFVIGSPNSKRIVNLFLESWLVYATAEHIACTYLLEDLDLLSKVDALENLLVMSSSIPNHIFLTLKNLDKFQVLYGKSFLNSFEIEEVLSDSTCKLELPDVIYPTFGSTKRVIMDANHFYQKMGK